VANSAGLLAGDGVLPAALVAPTWDRVEVDLSVSADGHQVECVLPTCAGIGMLKSAINGKLNTLLAARGTRKVMVSLCTGAAFRRRLYLLATVVRCAADVVMDVLDSSYDCDQAAQGIYNTGNVELDTALSYTDAGSSERAVLPSEVYNAVLDECAYYGICHPESSKDIDTYSFDLDCSAFSDTCVRCCFHPCVAKHFLGDDCGRCGGDYDFGDDFVNKIASCNKEVWAFHRLEGMRTSEVAAMMQFLAATKGTNLMFSQFVQHVEDEVGGRETALVNFMPSAVCRPTENRIDLSLMTPSMWWYRTPLKGYLRLIGTGTQLRAGFNIVDGLRVESDMNAASPALRVLYNGAAAVYTGPARGTGRTRWLMRGNAMLAPVAMPVGAPVARTVALDWFSSMLGTLNRAAAVSRNRCSVRLSVGRATRLPSAGGAITLDLLKRRSANDAHGAVLLSAGMRRSLAHADKAGVVSVKGSDF